MRAGTLTSTPRGRSAGPRRRAISTKTSNASLRKLISAAGRPDLCAPDHSTVVVQIAISKMKGGSMHSDKKVIEQLNAALSSELTAFVQ
jgi:hypothetical protein